MEAAVGSARWLLDKVVTQLSDNLVAAYVTSTELGLNMEKIKMDLLYTQGLLQTAQEWRDISDNTGLQRLLENLSKKADKAEDVLDELQYFIIQDQIDGTHEATPMVDDGLPGHILHGRHALRHTVGNLFSCFSCSSFTPDDADVPKENTVESHSDNDGYVSRLRFNRVDMSNKIKILIEGLHELCAPISDLLKVNQTIGRVASLKRPPTSSTIIQDNLYGRKEIFEQTLNDMTNYTVHSGTLSVLPIVGPGGIGKTTFVQHLYNDKKIESHFSLKVWVYVSTNFDVVRLAQEILKGMQHTENARSNRAYETSNLD
uniref:NB-ARC domain-containing protein n=1 Tax=Leersia perrieri TaxID=77586 RepID=A0A0D9VEH7_9ORYZ